MEEFFLEVEGRILQVLIEDPRGEEGTVPTLVCRAAEHGQVLPVTVPEPADTPPPTNGEFPGFPRIPLVLRARIEGSPELVDLLAQVRVDVSQLDPGPAQFELGTFASAALAAVGSRDPVVLDRDRARAWGLRRIGE
ncbi:MAG TPA: hypothetical protein VF063_04055 [Gaiellaceae bacterium]